MLRPAVLSMKSKTAQDSALQGAYDNMNNAQRDKRDNMMLRSFDPRQMYGEADGFNGVQS